MNTLDSNAPNPKKMKATTIKVLLFDDNEQSHIMIRDMMEVMDNKASTYQLDTVMQYDEALTMVQNNTYDVCIIDYMLQDPLERTGIDFVRDIRQFDIFTPIVLLTGQGNREVDLAAMNAGAVDYLDKIVISPHILERTLRYAVERSKLYDQIRELETLKTSMIRLAAHDFGSRISTVLVSADILNRVMADRLTIKEQEYIERIKATAQEMSRISGRYLSLERVENSIQRSKMALVDLTAVVSQVCREYTAHAQKNGSILKQDFPEDTINIQGDAEQLRDVVINLVDNAVKHTPPDGSITVYLKQAANYAIVEVTNTGEGIAPEAQEDIFQPFTHLEKDVASIKGMGLGLYIVKSIVRRHNGEVWVHSEPNKGSTFGFKLPLE